MIKTFLSYLNIFNIYDYLDSLTLLEESALIHLLIFTILLSCIITIISVFFGNELIKYFNLEEKYPRLGIFLRLRTKFQWYYLIFNILLMVYLCFLGIFINLLVFIKYL